MGKINMDIEGYNLDKTGKTVQKLLDKIYDLATTVELEQAVNSLDKKIDDKISKETKGRTSQVENLTTSLNSAIRNLQDIEDYIYELYQGKVYATDIPHVWPCPEQLFVFVNNTENDISTLWEHDNEGYNLSEPIPAGSQRLCTIVYDSNKSEWGYVFVLSGGKADIEPIQNNEIDELFGIKTPPSIVLVGEIEDSTFYTSNIEELEAIGVGEKFYLEFSPDIVATIDKIGSIITGEPPAYDISSIPLGENYTYECIMDEQTTTIDYGTIRVTRF